MVGDKLKFVLVQRQARITRKNICHFDFVSKFKAILVFKLRDFEWDLFSMKNMQKISIVINFNLFPLFISHLSVKIAIIHSYEYKNW